MVVDVWVAFLVFVVSCLLCRECVLRNAIVVRCLFVAVVYCLHCVACCLLCL